MRIISFFLICIILSCSNKKVNDTTLLLNEESQNISNDIFRLEAYLDSVQWRKHPDRLLYLINIEPQNFRNRLAFSNFLGCGELLTVDDLDRLFGPPNDEDLTRFGTIFRLYVVREMINKDSVILGRDSLGIHFTYNSISKDSVVVSPIVAIWEEEE